MKCSALRQQMQHYDKCSPINQTQRGIQKQAVLSTTVLDQLSVFFNALIIKVAACAVDILKLPNIFIKEPSPFRAQGERG